MPQIFFTTLNNPFNFIEVYVKLSEVNICFAVFHSHVVNTLLSLMQFCITTAFCFDRAERTRREQSNMCKLFIQCRYEWYYLAIFSAVIIEFNKMAD